MPRVGRQGGIWCLAALLLAPAPAAAQEAREPIRAELTYQVDPTLSDCPTASELTAAIATQLGRDPFSASARHRLRASIRRAGSGTEALVEWLDQQGGSEGERRLSSDSPECSEIARGLSFAIAVQLQLRESAEAPPAPPPAAPPTAPPKKPATPTPSPRRRVVMVGAGVLAQHGLTPDVSPGLRVFGSLGNERFSLEVSTQATLPAEWQAGQPAPPLTRPAFTARELSARLAPCVHHSVAGLCGVGMLGQLHVRGEGVDQVQSPSALVAGAGLRAKLLWPALSSFGALLQAEALVLLTPRTIMLNRRDVWSTAPVVLGASLDLAAIFQ